MDRDEWTRIWQQMSAGAAYSLQRLAEEIEMDEQTRQELQAELYQKRRALGAARLRVAQYGISADPYMVLQVQDFEREIRSLESRLGIKQPVTPEPPDPPRYTPQPEPAPAFERRIADQQTRERQKDIEQQMKLLNIHRRNMSLLREQARAHGGFAVAPLITQNNIIEHRQSIARIKSVLRDQYGVAVDDLTGDE